MSDVARTWILYVKCTNDYVLIQTTPVAAAGEEGPSPRQCSSSWRSSRANSC